VGLRVLFITALLACEAVGHGDACPAYATGAAAG